MPSSSSPSSSSSRTLKYDVFPSFSGEDVRKSFLSHLLKELHRKLIITFIDHGIERSRPIAPELVLAIRESRISIVVFSKNYASSTWCLNELVEIHECFKGLGQMVIPIFYEVDPSHVSKQTGEFGKAFDETCKGKREDEKQRWIRALVEVASIAGEDSQNWSDEAKMIEQISNDVSNKLFTPSDDFGDFVGIGAHIEAIMDSLLCLESEEVRMVGILGPSGIGKSTIARALFSRLSGQFHHRAFVSYKRTIQEKKITIQDDYSMKLVWAKQFLSEILGQKDIKIDSLGVVEQRLKHKKVLIVLDDVDEIELLETLVGRTEWFGFGSRIVVVTQDRALLKSHEIDLIYEVQFPSEDLALQMFCQSAFGQTSPPDGFMELAAEISYLSGNLPLGLNVLGSSLRGKDKEYWVEVMPRLRNGLNGKIEKTLRVSYDGLDEKDDQDTFLYIACLFNGKSVSYIEELLKGSVKIGLRILADKSLIRISPYKTVLMHSLLQKLGREIVRAESIVNPGKRRFLVDANDISDVFKDNSGTDNVLAIYCKISEIKEPLCMDKKSFKQMHNLQFLKFYKQPWGQKTGEIRFNLPGGLVYLPRKLRLLYWDEYPAKYIPSNFRAEHLVELTMKNSKLEMLWEGTQPLQSLKKMNITGSRDLKEIPDLSNATNLDRLNLFNCTSLVTLPFSIRNLKKLRRLGMGGCRKLEALPTNVNLESLEYLDLHKCSQLRSFPRISRNISTLFLDGTAMEEEDCFWIENLLELIDFGWENCPLRCMPSNFHPEHLRAFKMEDSKLEKLWTGVQSLGSLQLVNLSGSKNLKEIPGLSTSPVVLYLNGCKSLEMLHSSIQNLDKLKVWSMEGCENLKEIPDLPKATNLKKLILNNCKSLILLPSSIQHLDKLESLFMRGCTSLEVLPTNINLVSLTFLDLSGCSRLTSFPQLSMNTKELNLSETAIEEVPSWIENIAGLTLLQMRGCKQLRKISATIWNLKHLKRVDFTECGGITSVSDSSLVKTFHPMNSNTEFLFFSCFNLDRDAQEFILQSDFKDAVLPGKEVPTYFTHRTCGSSLTSPSPQSSVSRNHLGFTACVIIEFATDVTELCPKTIIVHWKFRGVTGMCYIDPVTNFYEMDHMVVFHFGFCPGQEVDDPPSQLDMVFEFELHNSILDTKEHDLQTCPTEPCKIKECGVRVLDVSPSQETEYTDQSGEETERCKKRTWMQVVPTQEYSNPPGGKTAVNTMAQVKRVEEARSSEESGRSKKRLHVLEGVCLDPVITVREDAEIPSEATSSSSQLTNFLRVQTSEDVKFTLAADDDDEDNIS